MKHNIYSVIASVIRGEKKSIELSDMSPDMADRCLAAISGAIAALRVVGHRDAAVRRLEAMAEHIEGHCMTSDID